MNKKLEHLILSCKALIPISIKKKVKNKINAGKYTKAVKNLSINKNKQKIIIMATPEHGNLGDHAIAKAQHIFLKDSFPNMQICEITGECYRATKDDIVNGIGEKDLIVISGGGFLGSLWMEEEELVRDIIRSFPRNPIVIFPQTIFYESTNEGREEFIKSREIYSRHTNILFAVRDRESIDKAQHILGKSNEKEICFIPDIVTYLNQISNKITDNNDREGILMCLREDKERVITKIDKESITKIARANHCNIRYTDTVIRKNINPENRDKYIEDKLNEFLEAKLVITDRLHGMLFAAITGTPCIAMNNTSGKVKGVYEWIKDIKYIKLINDTNELEDSIKELLKLDVCTYSNKKIRKEFDKFAVKIKERILLN